MLGNAKTILGAAGRLAKRPEAERCISLAGRDLNEAASRAGFGDTWETLFAKSRNRGSLARFDPVQSEGHTIPPQCSVRGREDNRSTHNEQIRPNKAFPLTLSRGVVRYSDSETSAAGR